MKIFYIAFGIRNKAGITRALLTKLNFLAEVYKYDVNIITITDEINGALFYSLHKDVTHYDLPLHDKNFFQRSKDINTVLQKENPDIVLVAMDNFTAPLQPLFIKKTFPMILERHSMIIIDYGMEKSLKEKITNKLKAFVMRLAVKSYDRLIILSTGGIKEWGNLNNIEVINNPVTIKAKKQSTLQSKKVLALGRYETIKGFDMLFQIWKKIYQEFPEWELVLYGEGREKENLEKLIIELNLEKSVTLNPPTNKVLDAYLDSSIYAMTSRSEGFPLVLLEAMSMGLPVVSFDCPNGPSDIITDQQDGFLIEPGDLDTFAKKLKLVMENAELRQHMGEAAVKKIKQFSPEVIMDQWDVLFKKLIPKYNQN